MYRIVNIEATVGLYVLYLIHYHSTVRRSLCAINQGNCGELTKLTSSLGLTGFRFPNHSNLAPKRALGDGQEVLVFAGRIPFLSSTNSVEVLLISLSS